MDQIEIPKQEKPKGWKRYIHNPAEFAVAVIGVLAAVYFWWDGIGQRRLKVTGDDYQFSGGLG